MRMNRSLVGLGAVSVAAVALVVAGTPSASIAAGPVASRQGVLDAVYLVSPTNTWMVGERNGKTLIEHWDGQSLQQTHSASQPDAGNFLQDVAGTSSDVWAIGMYIHDTNIGETLIEHWDGTEWKIVPSPSPGGQQSGSYSDLTGVTVVSPTDVWAVGVYSKPDGPLRQLILSLGRVSMGSGRGSSNIWVPYSTASAQYRRQMSGPSVNGTGRSARVVPLVEHWDGSQWQFVPLPPGGYELFDVSAQGADDVWAVGKRGHDAEATKSLIEHWDGSSWAIVPSPNDAGGSANVLSGVSADSESDAWAVGNQLVTHWDGSVWSLVKPASRFQDLNSVSAISPDDAWAVGIRNGAEVQQIERWDGTAWRRF